MYKLAAKALALPVVFFSCVTLFSPAAKATSSGVPIPTIAPGGPAYIFYGGVNPAAASQGPVLLFVHGLGSNATYWFTAGNDIYVDAYNAGWRSAYISFNADNSNNSDTIANNAAKLQQMLPTILAHFGAQQVYLVCHSKGGLDSQVAMEDPGFRSAIKGVFTMATPNQGTELADWCYGQGQLVCKLFGFQSPGLFDLRPESVLPLRAQLDPIFATAGVPFYYLAGTTYTTAGKLFQITGPILSSLTGGVANDGLVAVTEVPLPDSYSQDLGQIAIDHSHMGFGVNIWTYVYGRIRGLEDRQSGWKEIANGGFGDDANTWIWSQNWFNGKLYVGTGRSINCDIDYTAAVSTNFPLYPPPGNSCPPDGLDLATSAQIWQYTPQTHSWLMVYESPRDISLGINDNSGVPAYAARSIGYRNITPYTEADGTQAMYVGGVSAISLYNNLPQFVNSQYPAPVILRTTDGVNFTELPHDPGTFLGDIVKNNTDIQVASFRSIVAANGQMNVAVTDFRGEGFLIASPTPSQGNNTFRRTSPAPALSTLTAWVLSSYNNALYVGTGNRTVNTGYGVYKTTGGPNDPVPYTFTPIISNGGNQTNPALLSPTALSMHVWTGPDNVSRLYVGTDRKIEVVRVNPDDSWDVVVGEIRTLPDGSMKYPLSGIRYYFDNDFDGHVWQIQSSNSGLHASTWDWSVLLRSLTITNVATTGEQGFDFFRSPDAQHWYVVSKNGMGDGFNMGGRSGNYNHFGLFWGTARVQGGTQEWQDNSVLDLNNDGKISAADANLISAALGQTVVGFDARDVNGNGVIDAQDVQYLQSQCTFPNCSESPAPNTYYAPPPVNFTGYLGASTYAAVGQTATLNWPAQTGAVRYHIFRYTSELIQNLIFPSGSQTVNIGGNISLKFPDDAISGKSNQYCPTTPSNIAVESLWYCSLATLIQQNTSSPSTTGTGLMDVGFSTAATEIAQTTGLTYSEPLPTPLQSLYFVRWEDANGNLSQASNVVGAPSFAAN